MNVVDVDFPSNRRVATRSTEVNSGFNSQPPGRIGDPGNGGKIKAQ
jgi:hypothetical protein